MATQQAIQNVVTKKDLIQVFRKVGVTANMILEVHASLSSLGYVVGGAEAVVDALMETVTEGGTLLFATHTSENSDPSEWENPPASPDTWEKIRDGMLVHDAESSDLCAMGAIAENFRHRENVLHTTHPNVSYAAWGRYARLLTNRQSLHFPLAEESPAARLYELKGYVLLIGCDMDKVTCMHLSEYRTGCRPIIVRNACVKEQEKRIWKSYLDLDIDSDDFKNVKSGLMRKDRIKSTVLNGSEIQLFSAVDAIDEATFYFEKNSIYDLYR